MHYGLWHNKWYSPGQQKDINLVRLRIQALTLSNLVSTSNGSSIREHFICGCQFPDQKSESLAAADNANNTSTTSLEEVHYIHLHKLRQEVV